MNILGLMSGTSLDGIDLALCDIEGQGYRLLAADTVPYTDDWRRRLASLDGASALEYAQADVDLGHYMGQVINNFLSTVDAPVDAVASHGHTVFHQPDHGLTTQIGDGDAIAAETGLPVVCRFRSLDVALGGQGAPLVPIGDELLFGHYDACLNLGGIANISYRCSDNRMIGKSENPTVRIAFDICPCNMALNSLAARLDLAYDPQGDNARAGRCDSDLLRRLDDLDYYRSTPPKSLGKEWYTSCFQPLIDASALSVRDLLATVTRHVAGQIAEVLRRQAVGTLLVTGGGAFNRYLVETFASLAPSVRVTVPDPSVVNYKEAIVFALLGYLRLTDKVNTLRSVTGARCDSVGGNICGLIPRSRQE